MSILNEVSQLVDGVDVVSAKDIMDTQETAISAIKKADEALDKANNMSDSNKANLDASNLSSENITSWKEKLGVKDNAEQVEVIYDKDGGTPLDWDYSGGIPTGTTVTGKDFSKYKMLRVWGRFGSNTPYPALINMKYIRSGDRYEGYNVVGYGYESSSTRYIFEVGGKINSEKTSFTAHYSLKNLPDGREVGSDSNKRIIMIEGVY